MNKTIFNLSYKISMIIFSLLGVLLGFLSNVYYVNGLSSFIFYLLRAVLFMGIYFGIYVLEKNSDFKDSTRRMLGYLSVSYLVNMVCAIFSITHILGGVFLTISGLICFWLILAFVFELLVIYIDNRIINKIFNVNKKIGLAVAYPIVKLLSKKVTND